MRIDRKKWTVGLILAGGLGLGLVMLWRARRPAIVSDGTIAFVSACLLTVASTLIVVVLLKRGREAFRPTAIDLIYLAAVGWGWISFVVSTQHRGRVGRPFLLLTGFAVYLLARVAGRGFLDRRRMIFASFFVALASVEAGRGIWQYAGGAEMKGSFFNTNHFAMFLSLAAPAALAWAWSSRRAAVRIPGFALLGLFLACVFLSGCRSALAAGIIALGLMLGYGLRRPAVPGDDRSQRTRRLLEPLSVMGALVLIGFLASSFKPLSTVGRILTWKVSARVFLAHPVWGTGFSTFPAFYNPAQGDLFGQGLGSAAEKLSAAAGRYAFNDYLETAVELGLLGLALTAALGFLILRTVLILLRRTGRGAQRSVFDSAAAVSVLAYLVLSLFYYPSRILPIFLVFNIFLAWVMNAEQEPFSVARDAPPSARLKSPPRKTRNRNAARIAGLLFAAAAFCASIILLPAFFSEFSAEREWARAQALSGAGRETEALDLCRLLWPRLKADPDFLTYYGRLLLRQGRAEEAVQALEAGAASSSNPFVLESLAMAHERRGDFEAARRCALQASNILPWRLTSKAVLADIALRRGESARALRYAIEILETPMKVRTAEGTSLKRKALELWKGLNPAAPSDPGNPRLAAVLLLPDRFQAEALAALDVAGENAGQMIRAINFVPPGERLGLGFLVANMPDKDLQTLDAGFLADQVALAYKAWRDVPLAATVPEEIFLNYVLPYSVVDERRENWRGEFYARFGPMAVASPSIEDAVIDLNLNLIVQYRLSFRERDNRKRIRGLFETLKAGSVSCGEASLLLVDACRSVGIPARLVVLRRWAHVAAGHMWVEVYDRGRWRHLVGYDAGRLDQTWMEPFLEALDPSDPAQHIFASSFAKTGIHIAFGPEVCFVDITDAYRRKSSR
jgi:tetratricopeptide (TPR) repeat protein